MKYDIPSQKKQKSSQNPTFCSQIFSDLSHRKLSGENFGFPTSSNRSVLWDRWQHLTTGLRMESPYPICGSQSSSKCRMDSKPCWPTSGIQPANSSTEHVSLYRLSQKARFQSWYLGQTHFLSELGMAWEDLSHTRPVGYTQTVSSFWIDKHIPLPQFVRGGCRSWCTLFPRPLGQLAVLETHGRKRKVQRLSLAFA